MQPFDFDMRRDSTANNLPLDVHVRGYGYGDDGQGQGNDFRPAASLTKRKKPKSMPVYSTVLKLFLFCKL